MKLLPIALSAMVGAAWAGDVVAPELTECEKYPYKRECKLTLRQQKVKAHRELMRQKNKVLAHKKMFDDMKANTEKIKEENRKAKDQKKAGDLAAQRAIFDENRAPEILAHLLHKMGLRKPGVMCYREKDLSSTLSGNIVSFGISGESSGNWYAIATGASEAVAGGLKQENVLSSKMFDISIADGFEITSDYGRFTGKAWAMQNYASGGNEMTIEEISVHYTGDELRFIYCQEPDEA